jgi:hypothetical protein
MAAVVACGCENSTANSYGLSTPLYLQRPIRTLEARVLGTAASGEASEWARLRSPCGRWTHNAEEARGGARSREAGRGRNVRGRGRRSSMSLVLTFMFFCNLNELDQFDRCSRGDPFGAVRADSGQRWCSIGDYDFSHYDLWTGWQMITSFRPQSAHIDSQPLRRMSYKQCDPSARLKPLGACRSYEALLARGGTTRAPMGSGFATRGHLVPIVPQRGGKSRGYSQPSSCPGNASSQSSIATNFTLWERMAG